eukprot:1962118-Rhodomonas_salina.1
MIGLSEKSCPSRYQSSKDPAAPHVPASHFVPRRITESLAPALAFRRKPRKLSTGERKRDFLLMFEAEWTER